MLKLSKNFPKFQTVEWWIEQLKDFNPKAVVVVATASDAPLCLLSVYPGDDLEDDATKRVYIDVGMEC